jgi:hypothetical protein
MSKYHPIDRTHYAGKHWRRHSTYHFSAQDAVAALVAQELPKAHISLPIAFIKVDDNFTPVAVQGLKPGQNLFVAPDGRWLAGYTPATYRGYPFRLANTENDTQVLCVDEDSGLVTNGPEGETFLNEDGTPSPAVADVLNFLAQVEANRKVTARICAALQQHALIQPWPIKVQTDEGEQNIDGLFRIDEAALNALPADAFIELRDTGALIVAYCQLLSMQHLASLGQLTQAHAKAKAGQGLKTTPSGELDLEFLNEGGSINFGNLV